MNAQNRTSQRPPTRTIVFALITVAISLAFAVLLLEGGLRLMRPDERFLPYHKNTVKLLYPSEEVTPGVTGISRFSTNSFGTRGPEPANEKIGILTIGGSTTACTVLDDSETWPELLRGNLNLDAQDENFAWVTNSGIDGQNSHHHLMHANFLLPQLPNIDYVIIYAGLNDVGQWLYRTDFDPNYLQTQAGWNARIGEAFRISNYTDPNYPFYKHLEIWKQASILKDWWLSNRASGQLAAGSIVQDAELRWLGQMRESRASGEQKFVHKAKLDTLPAALDSYGATLTAISQATKRNGAEPIFVAQAIQHLFLNAEERKRLWMGHMDGGKTYIKEEQMYQILLQYNERMAKIAAQEQILFVDLPALIGGQGSLFYDGVHFNEHGARVMARALATYLEKNLLQDKGYSFSPS